VKLTYRKIHLIHSARPYVRGKSVIDIGCGDGLITASLGIDCKICGVDLGAEKLMNRYPGIRFGNFDATQNTLETDAEVALLFDVLEHLEIDARHNLLKALGRHCKTIIVNIPVEVNYEQIVEENVAPIDVWLGLLTLKFELIKMEKWKAREKEEYNFMVFQR